MNKSTSPYQHNKCQGCGEVNKPLFMRSPPRHLEDTWCKACMDNQKHIQ